MMASPCCPAAALLHLPAKAGCFAGNTTLVWVYVFEVQPLRTRALSTGIIIAALALQVRGAGHVGARTQQQAEMRRTCCVCRRR